jgi:hypothetical protein
MIYYIHKEHTNGGDSQMTKAFENIDGLFATAKQLTNEIYDYAEANNTLEYVKEAESTEGILCNVYAVNGEYYYSLA